MFICVVNLCGLFPGPLDFPFRRRTGHAKDLFISRFHSMFVNLNGLNFIPTIIGLLPRPINLKFNSMFYTERSMDDIPVGIFPAKDTFRWFVMQF